MMKGALLVLFLLGVASAKQYTRCQLARMLKGEGMDGFKDISLAQWLCVIKHESDYETQTMNRNADGSVDYGIFQINNRHWCATGVIPSANICKVSCGELLTDNISKSAQCAKTIVSQQGISAWLVWQKYCVGRDLSSYTAGCGL